MNLYTYIAHNNSQGANELLSNYGFKATNSIKELISRLKIIVRKYKKVALQDISNIHPDKSLLESFTKSFTSDKDFAYATGRTPGFAEPEVAEPTPFKPEAPSSFEPTSNTSNFDNNEIFQEIKEVKKEILREKVKRDRRARDKRMKAMQTSPLLLLAVGFAVGYIIAKK